jgi:hypothetical protein
VRRVSFRGLEVARKYWFLFVRKPVFVEYSQAFLAWSSGSKGDLAQLGG